MVPTVLATQFFLLFLSYKYDSISNLYIIKRPGEEETKAKPDPNPLMLT